MTGDGNGSSRPGGARSGTELLAAVLRLPPEAVAEARRRSPSRVRPRPQTGPSADYGAQAEPSP